jgi:hypothetical protein
VPMPMLLVMGRGLRPLMLVVMPFRRVRGARGMMVVVMRTGRVGVRMLVLVGHDDTSPPPGGAGPTAAPPTRYTGV